MWPSYNASKENNGDAPRLGMPWTKREIGMLGKFTDQEIAEKIGKTKSAVRTKRKLLGIKRPNRKFTAQDAAKLEKFVHEGKLRDEEIAKVMGKGESTIQLWRSRLGLPCPRPMHNRSWTAEEMAALGTIPDEEFAQRFNRRVDKVKAKRLGLQRRSGRNHYRWSSEELALLGKVNDLEIAEHTGLTTANIRGKRHRMGIPAFKPKANQGPDAKQHNHGESTEP